MVRAPRFVRRQSRLMGGANNVLDVFRMRGFDYGKVAEHSLNNRGITFRNELPDLDATGRAVYGTPMEHTRRRDRLQRQRMAERQAEAPNFSPDGVRMSTALMILAVMVLVGGMIVLIGRADLTGHAKTIASLQTKIEQTQERLLELDEEYAAAVASVDVGYKAVDLGMISTKSVEKRYLYVDDSAVMGPVVVNGNQMNTSFAAIPGN